MIYILISLILIVYMWKYCDVMLYERFNPKYQYGDYIYVHVYEISKKDVRDAWDILFDRQIRLTVPAKYRKYIKTICKNATTDGGWNYLQSSIAWKYTPKRY